MKTLILVRHAKAESAGSGFHDRDRPLAPEGERQAAHLGERLVARGVRPDLVLSSPAARALATARRVAAKLGCGSDRIVVEEGLYAARADTLLQRVRALDDTLGTVLLVGHNPAVSELALRDSPTITQMPPAAAAGLTFDVESWGEVGGLAPVTVSFDLGEPA